ncbi:MAG TPA: hypothetical protein VFK13_13205 [Gemmatimonadaceae bacterium]|nr:hypothetical protein [Gemmatimonadaceae bacterium]
MRPDLNRTARRWGAALVLSAACPAAAIAQSATRVLYARAVEPTAAFKIFDPAGTIRLVGWDRDSLLVRGRIGAGSRFFSGITARGGKFGVEPTDGGDPSPSELVVYVPRHGQLSVKSASADIRGQDVSGWFYSVSGTISLSGVSTSIEVESMNGNVSLDVTAPWVRARTGDGHLLLRGGAQDVDAATIGGTLDVATPSVLRGRFASVTGDIHYVGAPPAGGIFEFSNHSGAVDFLLPPRAGGVYELSTVSGDIVNGYTQVRPATQPRGGRSLRLDLGPDGGHVTVRTFKGPIRLRRQ